MKTNRISELFATFIIVMVSLSAHSGQETGKRAPEESAKDDLFAMITLGFRRINLDVNEHFGVLAPEDPCETTVLIQNYVLQEDSSDTGHITGEHGVRVKFKNKCSCGFTCRNDCSPQVAEKSCFEEGNLDFGTKPQGYQHITGTLVSVTNSNSGIMGPVQCNQSVACGITSTDQGEGTISSHQLNQSFTCGECTVIPNSPIVLNINGKPFAFSDDNDTVAFDIDMDGIKENLGWTLENSRTAFLVLDRNNNGTIDNGSELFGNHTQQPDSPRPNGYLALKVFDDNDDGVISASDTVFHQLMLWTDRNHNGMSEKSELAPAYLHLQSIGLNYVRSDRQDRAGNTLALFGAAVTKNHKEIFTVDVNFLEVIEMGD